MKTLLEDDEIVRINVGGVKFTTLRVSDTRGCLSCVFLEYTAALLAFNLGAND